MPVAFVRKKGSSMEYIFIIFLFFCTVWDIRKQKIPAVLLYTALLLMSIYAGVGVFGKQREVVDIAAAAIPGGIIFILAKKSHQIGLGDALLILLLGIGFSLETEMKILMISFFMAAIASVVLLIFECDLKNRRIPFVPYLFMASGIVLFG